LESLAASADVIISSSGSELPLLTRRMMEPIVRQRRGKPIFLIDIALPRDIEPSVGQIRNVYLYNLDDLQKVVAASQSQRGNAVSAASEIVASAVDEFFAWHRARQQGPLIDDLYRRAHAIAREELARTLTLFPNISPQERAHLDDLARRIVNKLLHDPIKSLRAAGAQPNNGDNGHAPPAEAAAARDENDDRHGRRNEIPAKNSDATT
jgi:glutamyl-tRNA reductase